MKHRIFDWCKRVVFGFFDTNCTMHAAGLTYFALLAVVPVLCCILVAAKACHVDEYARTQINAKIDAMIVQIETGQDGQKLPFFSSLDTEEQHKKRIAASEFARQARQISNALFERIEKFDVGTLGWIGFGFLLWTLISSLASVETSFNEIFGIKTPRPVWKRASLYLFILIVLPILATVAMSLPILGAVKNILVATMGRTWLTKWVSDGLITILDSRLFGFSFTLLAASLAFGFFFWIIPNCPVRKGHAWWGGLLTAVLFGGWMKICAVAQVGIARSSALYGSFAFLPIVLAWLYMSWQIVLLGANMVRSFGGVPGVKACLVAALLAVGATGCQSYEIVQSNIFSDDRGNVVRVDYGRSDSEHVNTFRNPQNGKEYDFKSKLVVDVTLPDGDDFTAWQCMNFQRSGTMYRTDNEKWMLHADGFRCVVYRRMEKDKTRYRVVYQGILCESPKSDYEPDERWRKLKKNAKGEWK